MSPMHQRLNNSQIVRVYRHMIENATVDIVRDLRKNIQEQAPDHPRAKDLEVFFKQRLGE
jgi:hypothetical protein